MTITIYVAEKPSTKEDCSSIFTVENAHEARVHLWALAKQAKPDWAMFWMPTGIEPITNAGMRSREVPSEIAAEVDAEVLRQNKLVMEAIVTEALNSAYDELSSLFHSTPGFVQLLSCAAESWAKECYQAH